MAELVQWNMRGLQANREEINLLISSLNPSVIALQETNIGKHHNINFSNHFIYNCFGSETNGVFHGASDVMVNKAVPHKLLSLQTNLQAVAVRTTLSKTIIVCSVYVPPSQKWDIKDRGLICSTPLSSSTTWGF